MAETKHTPEAVSNPQEVVLIDAADLKIVRSLEEALAAARDENAALKVELAAAKDVIRHWNVEMSRIVGGSEFYNCPEAYVRRFQEHSDAMMDAMRKRKEADERRRKQGHSNDYNYPTSTGGGMKVGIAVDCTVCGLRKKPIGRSVPLWMARSLCDWPCPGYYEAPLSGSLFPGETEEEFGYYVGPHGVKENHLKWRCDGEVSKETSSD